jgi:hypothetical protein
MFRFKKPSTATYAAPSVTYSAPAQSAAAIAITWTTNEPTTSLAFTIADGEAPTSTELGIATKAIVTELNLLRTDLIATNAALAKAAVDVAASNTALAKIAVDDADLRTVLAEPN